MEKIGNQEISEAGLVDWRKLAQALHARYPIPDYVVAAAFVTAVAQAAEAAGHHPDLKLTSGVIDVSLCTHEDGLWVTRKDIDMARRIREIARQNGLESQPGAVTQLELALDTAHEATLGLPANGSPLPSRPVGPSSTTPKRRPSPCWPTPTATGPASAPHSTAAERIRR